MRIGRGNPRPIFMGSVWLCDQKTLFDLYKIRAPDVPGAQMRRKKGTRINSAGNRIAINDH